MEISISEYLKLDPTHLIDIRSYEKYQRNHIPSAISIDYRRILSHPEQYLNKKETYYFYCDTGFHSKILVQRLNQMGYSAISISGGFKNYLLRK